MTFAIDWTRTLDQTAGWFFFTDCGVHVCTDKSLVAIMGDTDGSDEIAQVYRSTDDGLTWSATAQLAGNSDAQQQRALNMPGNILLYQSIDIIDNTVTIHRSANAGASWSTVATFHKDRPPSVALSAHGGLTYNRTMGAFFGRYDTTTDGGTNINMIRSTDAGLTWTLAEVITPSNATWTYGAANGGNGNWLCTADLNRVYWSSNYGADWTLATGPTPPTGFLNSKLLSPTFLTPDIALVGGLGTATGNTYWPYLYRSTDKGHTWTHIPASDIADWPTTHSAGQIFETHRVTKEFAIFGWNNTSNPDTVPWRISLDQGLTWNFTGSAPDYPATGEWAVSGAIVISPSGALIVPVTGQLSGVVHSQIYRGIVSC